MKKCNMCGNQLPDSFTICPNCGIVQPQQYNSSTQKKVILVGQY